MRPLLAREFALEEAWELNQWLFLVPLKGGREYITTQKAIYKWYILPIGGLYATYHLLGEPETAIDLPYHSAYVDGIGLYISIIL